MKERRGRRAAGTSVVPTFHSTHYLLLMQRITWTKDSTLNLPHSACSIGCTFLDRRRRPLTDLLVLPYNIFTYLWVYCTAWFIVAHTRLADIRGSRFPHTPVLHTPPHYLHLRVCGRHRARPAGSCCVVRHGDEEEEYCYAPRTPPRTLPRVPARALLTPQFSSCHSGVLPVPYDVCSTRYLFTTPRTPHTPVLDFWLRMVPTFYAS